MQANSLLTRALSIRRPALHSPKHAPRRTVSAETSEPASPSDVTPATPHAEPATRLPYRRSNILSRSCRSPVLQAPRARRFGNWRIADPRRDAGVKSLVRNQLE